jgi:hypothetical protein
VRTRWFPLLALALLATGLCSVLAAPRHTPEPFDAVRECLLESHVGPASPMGSLLVYPVELPRQLHYSRSVTPIACAMSEGTVTVEELPGGMDQFRLFASNNSDRDVFSQGGGFFQGGGQDRGGGGGLFGANMGGELVVACVEEGRLTGDSTRFIATEFSLAHPVLRAALAIGDQNAIWQEVARERRVFGCVDSASTSYRMVEQSARVREERSRLALEAPTWDSSSSGIVVACGDRIVGFELYGSPALLEEHRDLLLNSYAMLNAELGGWTECRVNRDDVCRFLTEASGIGYRQQPSPGIGTAYAMAAGPYAGAALMGYGSLVHVGLYDTRPLSE